jgi:hypothetical protein
LDCIIGRRRFTGAASLLYPCQDLYLKTYSRPEALARSQHRSMAAVVLTKASPPKSSKTKTAAPGSKMTVVTGYY